MIELTSDDEGKRVTLDDERLGTVREVDNASTAIIDPESDLDDATKSELGWTDEQDVYRIRDDAVETVTDEEIRVQLD